ncbi:uncharacterized protein LOC110825711 [Carica papaya]|uniref:uncharacterized protein LOC110825711 n=1 Tax=Carica papaya TaxID=3649 RepID=UPI000B8CF558|nr:uncharacterized protein LOC110825711 [Carica papaya]XP_021911889.1 uncharacterized protein LOC110825711 [Carica papaya]XP_021911890.1 uncharacterized protein LOC110825711 [Carica papaya]
MAGETASSEEKLNASPPPPPPPPPPPQIFPIDYRTNIESKTLEDALPWIDHAVQQALLYQRTFKETMESAIEACGSRFSEIRSTSSAHFQQSIDSMRDLTSEYGVYERIVFGKVKEGINVAVSHPLITGGVAFGLRFLSLKRTRRFLYYSTMQMFISEEALLSKADIKVKELRQSIDRLKAESDKLERSASVAEEELVRGRMKLRQAGKQIQGAINSAYKIERQAAGLKDIIGELPRREASRFRSQVSRLASEATRERNALTKEVNKISNYGISV